MCAGVQIPRENPHCKPHAHSESHTGIIHVCFRAVSILPGLSRIVFSMQQLYGVSMFSMQLYGVSTFSMQLYGVDSNYCAHRLLPCLVWMCFLPLLQHEDEELGFPSDFIMHL